MKTTTPLFLKNPEKSGLSLMKKVMHEVIAYYGQQIYGADWSKAIQTLISQSIENKTPSKEAQLSQLKYRSYWKNSECNASTFNMSAADISLCSHILLFDENLPFSLTLTSTQKELLHNIRMLRNELGCCDECLTAAEKLAPFEAISLLLASSITVFPFLPQSLCHEISNYQSAKLDVSV